MTEEQRKKFAEVKSVLTEQVVPKQNETTERFEARKKALRFKQIESFKEILLQDISSNRTNRTFTQYTKSLVKSYIQNPYSYRTQLIQISKYLWRMSTLYKKIVIYHPTMFTYNYNVIERIDITKEYNPSKNQKKYSNLIKTLQNVDHPREFSTSMILAIRDGISSAYIYGDSEDGIFWHFLDPEYFKIVGKNTRGQWVIAYDMTFFSKGNNVQFVEGVDGDTSGCWSDEWIQAWKDYQADNQGARWHVVDPSKTITLLANEDDEFDVPMPFYTGLFLGLLDILDYEQIVADKTALENYVLLVSKIPLMDGTQTVDDFAISLEMVQAMQELIDAAVPSLVGTAYSPMDIEPITLKDKSTKDDTDIVSRSIENLFSASGASKLVISNSSSSNSVGLKYSLMNDKSLAFHMLDKLESNWNYFVEQNIQDGFIFKFLRQTWYDHDEVVNQYKDAASFGGSPMLYLLSMDMTPYEVWCQMNFDAGSGIRDLMIPLQSSYTSNSERSAGAPSKDETELTDEGIKSRDGDKNAGTAANG